jgi:Rrf2 family protein
LRVTTAGRYALRAMLDLALNGQAGPVLRQEITTRQEISSEYIAQLFRPLVKAGLVRSVMGPGGGYQLTQPAQEIKVGDILRAVEGPFAAVACVVQDQSGAEGCPRVEGCAARVLWQRLTHVIEEYLDSVTLWDICELAGQLKEPPFAQCEDAVTMLVTPLPDLPACPGEYSI